MMTDMQITTMHRRLPPAPLLALCWLALCWLALAGCVYHIPIQQGNHLDATTVEQVKPGMTRTQVRYLLGTPMVPGGFVTDRWDYDYYLKLRRFTHPQRAHATVYFHNDLVERLATDVRSDPAEPVSNRPVHAPSN